MMHRMLKMGAAIGMAPMAMMLFATSPALAQDCEPSWVPTFGELPGVNNNVNDFAVWDDGTGPALFVAGRFNRAGGATESNFVAKWNGSGWEPLTGNELGGFDVKALAVFDDGTGPALYAGGSFTDAGSEVVNHIAKWDGQEWSGVGGGINSNGFVISLEVFDDGTGPALYAGGRISSAGGVSASRIAKWDGTSWSEVGGGTNNDVITMEVFDDGTGPALYAGGLFNSAGGSSAVGIARWDGTSWSPVGGGFNTGSVNSLTVHDDGTGPALYAGGGFTSAGGTTVNRVAKWDGTSWSALGSGIGGSLFSRVNEVIGFDDGTGPKLIAVGSFNDAGGTSVTNAAQWDGQAWSPLGEGTDVSGETLAVFDEGEGPVLFVGGPFLTAGGVTSNRVARWDGQEWSTLGTGSSGQVDVVLVSDDGPAGPGALYAAGIIPSIGNVQTRGIGVWDGTSWSALGNGFGNFVLDLEIFDDGTGPVLYATGTFTSADSMDANRIARWTGTQWEEVGGGLSNLGASLAVFDDGTGPALYVGGSFADSGSLRTNGIARWDGSFWSFLAPQGANGRVETLLVYDDGTGPALYAGGSFSTMGGSTVNGIARWDGEVWNTVGPGFLNASGNAGTVLDLTVFDDGTGPALYATGTFTQTADGNQIASLAKWDGNTWTEVGSGLDDIGWSLQVFEDSEGQALFIGGNFTQAGSTPASGLARWDGTLFQALGDGVNDTVRDLAVYSPGPDQRSLLVAAGDFITSPALDSYLAAWDGCAGATDTCPADIDGNGLLDADDFFDYLDLFASGDPGANFDDDPALDANDFFAFLSEFAAGCP